MQLVSKIKAGIMRSFSRGWGKLMKLPRPLKVLGSSGRLPLLLGPHAAKDPMMTAAFFVEQFEHGQASNCCSGDTLACGHLGLT